MARMISLKIGEQKRLTIDETTMDGAPSHLEGAPTYAVKSGDCTVVPIDEHNAWLVAGEEIGECRILMEVRVDTGDGPHVVKELLLVQVHGDCASDVGLTVGEAEPKAHGHYNMSTAVGEESHTSTQEETHATHTRRGR